MVMDATVILFKLDRTSAKVQDTLLRVNYRNVHHINAQISNSDLPLHHYSLFQKSQNSSPKVSKNRVLVDHSFRHLFDYSAIRFENRKSDLEITQCNDGMVPVQIPFGLAPENP